MGLNKLDYDNQLPIFCPQRDKNQSGQILFVKNILKDAFWKARLRSGSSSDEPVQVSEISIRLKT
jgi:hypothetical protein